MSRPWYEWDSNNETLQEKRDRCLLQMPQLSPIELEVLRQLLITTWDGYIKSKSARDSLYHKGLIVRWNGWQVISREGLAIIDTLGELGGQVIKQCRKEKKA
jgi:hypothetical protein